MDNGKKDFSSFIEKTSALCAKYFHIKYTDLYSKKLGRTESLARHLLWYILHVDYGVPTSILSNEFFRTRRHIFFGINKIRQGVRLQKFYNDLLYGFKIYISQRES